MWERDEMPLTIRRESALHHPNGAVVVSEAVSENDRSIVIVRMSDADDATQQANCDEALRILSSQEAPFAVIIDMRGVTKYPATQRKMYADVRTQLQPIYARLHRLTVYVAENDLQRGFVTAVGWRVHAGPGSGRVFTLDFEEAWRLCSGALRAR
jgi:hypothetical protein